MGREYYYWLIYRDDGFDDGVGTIISKRFNSHEEAQEELLKWRAKKDGHNYFSVQHQDYLNKLEEHNEESK